MKRFAVLILVFILVMSLPSVAFAEPEQIGCAVLEETMTGAAVQVTVDLGKELSIGFLPAAFYLYDQPEKSINWDYLAFGTLLSEQSYLSLEEGHADSVRTEEDGYVVFTEAEGRKTFAAPIADDLYIMLMIDPAADADAVWARVSYEKMDYDYADPVQKASGVLADSMDKDLLVNVTVDLTYGWSAKFLPMAFYLYNEDTVGEDYEVYGTLLNETDLALIRESHADDETFVEKDGRITYKTDSYTGIIAPIDGVENEYITLIVYGIYDPEGMWERLSYELF